MDASIAISLWNETIAMLRRLFSPLEIRLEGLEALAAIESPSDADIEAVVNLVTTSHHVTRFLGAVSQPVCLDALFDAGLLDPPEGRGPWPAFAAIERLAPTHADALAEWLGKVNDKFGADPRRVAVVARGALDLGLSGSSLVLRILERHPTDWWIVEYGITLAAQVEASSQLVEQVADVVLNPASAEAIWYPDLLIEQLVTGVDATNALKRVELLVRKLCQGSDPAARLWFVEYGPGGDDRRLGRRRLPRSRRPSPRRARACRAGRPGAHVDRGAA